MNEKLLEKARAAKSAEELLELAKAEGKELTAEQAAKLYARLHPAQGELADEALDGVAGGEDLDSVYGGGCDGGDKKPERRKFAHGDIVVRNYLNQCSPKCECTTFYVDEYVEENRVKIACMKCWTIQFVHPGDISKLT